MAIAEKTTEILADRAALIEQSKELVLFYIRAAIKDRNRCTIALAG